MAKLFKSGGRDFKPGDKANPNVGPKVSRDIKKIRELTTRELKVIGDIIVLGTRADLKALLENPDTSALQAWIAAVAVKGISRGDMGSLNELLNRLIGKVTDKLDASHHHLIDQIKEIDQMTNAELIRATQDAIALLKVEEGQSETSDR